MINFLQETLHHMDFYNQSFATVSAIFGSAFQVTIEDFKVFADVDYDDGFGAQEMPTDIVILYNDGSWSERTEYDGSEGWSYKKTPTPPNEFKPVKKLKTDAAWEDLAEMAVVETEAVHD